MIVKSTAMILMSRISQEQTNAARLRSAFILLMMIVLFSWYCEYRKHSSEGWWWGSGRPERWQKASRFTTRIWTDWTGGSHKILWLNWWRPEPGFHGFWLVERVAMGFDWSIELPWVLIGRECWFCGPELNGTAVRGWGQHHKKKSGAASPVTAGS